MTCAIGYTRSVDSLAASFWYALLAAIGLFAVGLGIGAIYGSTYNAPETRTIIFSIPIATTVTETPSVTVTQPPPPLLP
jgi:hypothetical protein